MTRCSAISSLLRPPATRPITSRSGGVSSSSCSGPGSPGSGREASSEITRRTTAGETAASPAATVRTAATRAAASVSLGRKPLAPARREASTSSSVSESPRMTKCTFELRGSAMIVRVTSTASTPGSPMSISTTSGRSLSTSAIMPCPSPADPATTMSGSSSSRAWSPALERLSPWAIRSRISHGPGERESRPAGSTSDRSGAFMARILASGPVPRHTPDPETMLRLTRLLTVQASQLGAHSRVLPMFNSRAFGDDRLVELSILIVDDDPEFVALATRVLVTMGAQVVATASDAASALAAAHEKRPQVALVDVGLPDRNGIDLGSELAGLPWAPQVVLTSTDSDAEGEIGDQGPSLPFLPKEELATDRLRVLLQVE